MSSSEERTGAIQRHFVACCADSDRVVGYGAVECGPEATPRAFRLFVVTDPADLPSVGSQLYEHALLRLHELGARRVWFTEHAEDSNLGEFARARGFRETRRFRSDRVELIVLERRLGSEAARV